jgi:hypothetical protein
MPRAGRGPSGRGRLRARPRTSLPEGRCTTPGAAESQSTPTAGSYSSTPADEQPDPLRRMPVCAAGQPARLQVSRCIGLSVSDRELPPLTGRSGTSSAVAYHGWRLGALSSSPPSAAPSTSSKNQGRFRCWRGRQFARQPCGTPTGQRAADADATHRSCRPADAPGLDLRHGRQIRTRNHQPGE